MIRKLSAYLKAIRWFEIGVRLGSPLIAILLSIPALNYGHFSSAILGLIGFFFCWVHGYALNEWGGYYYDRYDPSKGDRPIISGALSRDEMLKLAIVAAVICVTIFAMLRPVLLLIVGFDIVLGIFYCHPRLVWKGKPFFSFFALFSVSVTDFLLGWLIFSNDIKTGATIGIFFGLLGITGISFHEVGDYDSDLRAGVRTNAVRFGKGPISWIGFLSYSLALFYLHSLIYRHLIPEGLIYPFLLTYPIYLFLFWRCLRGHFGAMAVKSFIRGYRLIYFVIGIAIIWILLKRG